MQSVTNHRQKLDRLLAKHSLAKQQVLAEKKVFREAESRVTNVEDAQKLVQSVAETIQESAHRQISSVVTRCLEAVFGEEAYQFKICFEKKRGKTDARLVFVRDGQEVDPNDSVGGGVLDLAAFSLRLACVMLGMPKRRRLLCLDEPMKFVSKEYHPAVREMLETLADELGLQMIMVTHAAGLACGKVVELE